MALISTNPASGEELRSYPETTAAEVDEILSLATEAQRGWGGASFAERGACLRRAAAVLRGRTGEYARLMALEMGKPVREGRAEVEKCAWVCEYYAEHGEAMLQPEPVDTDASRSYVAFRPLGTVLAVMPWNFPFWQVFRFAAPGLMAGNAGLLKHASNVSGCALAIEAVIRDAGFPEHLFRTLLIGSARVASVIEDARVQAVTLTGSTPAGRAVAAAAGAALKKSVLELGGSDPYVILSDADLDMAVPACVASRLINSGQSCIAAKRFIVVGALYDDFVSRFVEEMRGTVMGDPMDEASDLGPMARHDLRDDLRRQVVESIRMGAACRLGGIVPDGPGAYYPPTVLTDVGPGMPAYDEELFGPVAAVIPVEDDARAVIVANDSRFGLGAAVFTRDVERGRRMAELEFEAGACFVNASVRSDPRLPFGGIKESGYGRELGIVGIREFVNIKSVYVA